MLCPYRIAVLFIGQRVQIVDDLEAVVVAVVQIVHAQALDKKVVLQFRVVAHQSADFHDVLPLHQNARVAAKQIDVQNGVRETEREFFALPAALERLLLRRVAGAIEP